MDVKQKLQKTYYDRSRYGPSYKAGEKLLVFMPTAKRGETRKITSFYSGPIIIVDFKTI